VLRHILERDLAELMSNPRLPALLEMRLASARSDVARRGSCFPLS